MDEQRECPQCGRFMSQGHMHNGIVRFDVSEQRPATVWVCENCWYDEPLSETSSDSH